jgi:hypothetical protein
MQTYVFLDAYADAGETGAMLLYKQLAADKINVAEKWLKSTKSAPLARWVYCWFPKKKA